MNYDQFTLKTQDALQAASSLAQQNDHSEIPVQINEQMVVEYYSK